MSSAWQRGKLINRTKNDWRINKQLIRTESEWKDYAMSTFIRDINCTNWINIRLLKIFYVCIFNQSNGLGVNLRPSSKSVFRHPLFRVFKWCFFYCFIFWAPYIHVRIFSVVIKVWTAVCNIFDLRFITTGIDLIWSKLRWILDMDIYTTSQFAWINNKQSWNQFTSH